MDPGFPQSMRRPFIHVGWFQRLDCKMVAEHHKYETAGWRGHIHTITMMTDCALNDHRVLTPQYFNGGRWRLRSTMLVARYDQYAIRVGGVRLDYTRERDQ